MGMSIDAARRLKRGDKIWIEATVLGPTRNGEIGNVVVAVERETHAGSTMRKEPLFIGIHPDYLIKAVV